MPSPSPSPSWSALAPVAGPVSTPLTSPSSSSAAQDAAEGALKQMMAERSWVYVSETSGVKYGKEHSYGPIHSLHPCLPKMNEEAAVILTTLRELTHPNTHTALVLPCLASETSPPPWTGVQWMSGNRPSRTSSQVQPKAPWPVLFFNIDTQHSLLSLLRALPPPTTEVHVLVGSNCLHLPSSTTSFASVDKPHLEAPIRAGDIIDFDGRRATLSCLISSDKASLKSPDEVFALTVGHLFVPPTNPGSSELSLGSNEGGAIPPHDGALNVSSLQTMQSQVADLNTIISTTTNQLSVLREEDTKHAMLTERLTRLQSERRYPALLCDNLALFDIATLVAAETVALPQTVEGMSARNGAPRASLPSYQGHHMPLPVSRSAPSAFHRRPYVHTSDWALLKIRQTPPMYASPGWSTKPYPLHSELQVQFSNGWHDKHLLTGIVNGSKAHLLVRNNMTMDWVMFPQPDKQRQFVEPGDSGTTVTTTASIPDGGVVRPAGLIIGGFSERQSRWKPIQFGVLIDLTAVLSRVEEVTQISFSGDCFRQL